MLTIGLTGPSGAGKGTVASLFAQYGIPSIDTDAVYHALLIPPSACLDALVERFGAGILTADGILDRKALAALVFAEGNAQDLRDLNTITHRFVLDEVRRRLAIYEAEGKRAVLVDAPQLFESGFDAECGRILSVLAPETLRMARIILRDGLTYEQAEARLKASHSDEFFRAHSDVTIINDGGMDALDEEVLRWLIRWEVIP